MCEYNISCKLASKLALGIPQISKLLQMPHKVKKGVSDHTTYTGDLIDIHIPKQVFVTLMEADYTL